MLLDWLTGAKEHLSIHHMILEEYLTTVFLAAVPEGGWPEAFHIITACNPGEIVSDEVNVVADGRLREELECAVASCFRIFGCSPDLYHQEQSWGVVGLTNEEAVTISRKFGQNALFEIKEGVLTVVGCLSGERITLGTFHSRIHPNSGETPTEKARISFLTTSGRKVHFESLSIEESNLGWMEGSLFLHREHTLERLTKTAEREFGVAGILLQEPPPGPLPAFKYRASFHCNEPIEPENDCSSLDLVWFSDSLPSDLQLELRSRFKDVNWEAYAKDGIY
jgi:Protein of unknown function (DUF3293)